MNTPKETKSRSIQVRFRPNEITHLKKLAEKFNFLSISEFVRTSIREYCINRNIDINGEDANG